jgi:DNA-directed RNA polymerase subunit RPC12/RpoP
MPNLVCKRCGETFFQERGRPARRCPPCREETATYGREHRELRAEVAPFAIGTACARCGRPITDDDWQLDHRDDGGGYLGPSHKRCNAKAGAIKLIQQKERAYKLVRQAEAAGVDLSKLVSRVVPGTTLGAC